MNEIDLQVLLKFWPLHVRHSFLKCYKVPLYSEILTRSLKFLQDNRCACTRAVLKSKFEHEEDFKKFGKPWIVCQLYFGIFSTQSSFMPSWMTWDRSSGNLSKKLLCKNSKDIWKVDEGEKLMSREELNILWKETENRGQIGKDRQVWEDHFLSPKRILRDNSYWRIEMWETVFAKNDYSVAVERNSSLLKDRDVRNCICPKNDDFVAVKRN